jgi:GNAT superfamily N-acetyltransferase
MDYTIIQVSVGDPFWSHVAEHSPQTVQYMADPNDGGNYHCFLAMGADNAFLGLSIVDVGPMHFGPLADETTGFLENILVLPAYRRQGIGTDLLQAALDNAWEAGARHVRWTVGYEDEGLPFYHKLGFAFVPEEDPQNEHPERYYTVVAVNPGEAMKTKAKTLSPLERTAYHEAGHAVLGFCLRFGRTPKTASIVASGEDLGSVESIKKLKSYPDFEADAKTAMTWEHELMVCLAGLVAEKIACGRYDYKGASEDLQAAKELVKMRSGDGASGRLYHRWAKRRTADLLEAHWQNVERVAEALLKHKKLNSRQLIQAFNGESVIKMNMQDLSDRLKNSKVNIAQAYRLLKKD